MYYNTVTSACELYKQNKYEDAIILLKTISAENIKDLVVKNQYYYCKAVSYEKISKYNLAIENARKSLEIQGINSEYYFRAYSLLGTIFKKLFQPDEALKYYEKALKISQLENDISDIESNIGSCLMQKQQYDEALTRFQKALTIKEKKQDDRNKDMLELNIAVTNFYLSNVEESEKIFNKLIQDTKKERNPHEQIFLYYNYAGILFTKGDFQKTIKYLKKALKIASINKYKNEEQFHLRALGLVYRKNGQKNKALDYYKKSITVAEKIGNININEEFIKISFYKQKGDIYQSIVELCYDLKDFETAFLYSQKSKAKTFRDLYSIENLKILSKAEIQVKLKNQSKKITIVDYFFSSNCLYIFTINQNSFDCKKVNLEINILNNLYKYFKEEIIEVLDRKQPDIGESWLELGNYLLEPISNDIISSDIIYFIPAGILNRFPLHSLKINNERLISKYAVGYLPTISLLNIWEKNTKIRTQNAIYGFGNSVEQEAINIKKFIKGEFYIGAQVTKEIVKKTINNKNIAYFSCHGNYSKSFPLESGITLSDGSCTIEDIKSMRINTNMVVLSACQSALGTIDNHNESIGFAQALLQAGVKTVIASLWSVDIQATEKLMSFFVENLNRQNKITSLQNAQKKLMSTSDYEHPFFHAGFILMGNWL